jgi:hypothetical protein
MCKDRGNATRGRGERRGREEEDSKRRRGSGKTEYASKEKREPQHTPESPMTNIFNSRSL